MLPKALKRSISMRPKGKKPSTPRVEPLETDLITERLQDGPRVLNIYFPDHQNKLLHYPFDDTSRISDLFHDLLKSEQSPVADDMHEVYSLCIPSNGAQELRRVPIGNQVIWSYFLISHDMEYRMLPTELVEELDLSDLYLRVNSSLHKSTFLLKVAKETSGYQVFTLLCEEFDIPIEEQSGYGLYKSNEESIQSAKPICEMGVKQMMNISFRRQHKFILRKVDITVPHPPLQLEGDIQVEEAIRLIVSWLGYQDSSSYFGLLWKSPSMLLEPDLPILSWLPPFSRFLDWEFKTNSEIIFATRPCEEYGEINEVSIRLIFLSTPETNTSVSATSLKSFVKPSKLLMLAGETYLATYRNVFEISKCISAPKHQPRTVGTLFITNYRIIMNSFSTEPEGGSHLLSSTVNIPLGQITRVVVSGKDIIDVHCKNHQIVGFQSEQASIIAQTLESACFVPVPECFAFEYCEEFPVDTDGWEVYDFRREMQRQGVPNNHWRICTDNEEYECSPTYPQQYAVPATFTNDSLKSVYSYRSKGRIPVLTYLHTNGASITRCSQPLVGLTSKSSNEDKDLLHKIRQSAGASSILWMLDARPKASAVANRVMDGGYETNYSNCKIKFCNIENIHVMRHSVKDLVTACNEYSAPYMLAVSQSKWLDHLFVILSAAHKAAKLVLNGSSVMVHCSDGWDRTPQVSTRIFAQAAAKLFHEICALAQILLDPYYRTLEGFEVLIEKDWCSFGHKFGQRLGHCSSDHSDSERSPVFAQFLDCVWQIKNQFPKEFEFTDGFLKCLLYHSTSCRFGTFLFDNDCQRKGHLVHRRTISLWTFIKNNLYSYTNPSYDPSGAPYLKPFIADRSLEIWKEIYCFQSDYAAQYRFNELAQEASLVQMYQENLLLQERVKQLEGLVKKAKKKPPPVPPRNSQIDIQNRTKRSLSLLSRKNSRVAREKES